MKNEEKEYNVWGKIIFEVDMDVTATSYAEAEAKVREMIVDEYHFDSHGATHKSNSVNITLITSEYND